MKIFFLILGLASVLAINDKRSEPVASPKKVMSLKVKTEGDEGGKIWALVWGDDTYITDVKSLAETIMSEGTLGKKLAIKLSDLDGEGTTDVTTEGTTDVTTEGTTDATTPDPNPETGKKNKIIIIMSHKDYFDMDTRNDDFTRFVRDKHESQTLCPGFVRQWTAKFFKKIKRKWRWKEALGKSTEVAEIKKRLEIQREKPKIIVPFEPKMNDYVHGDAKQTLHVVFFHELVHTLHHKDGTWKSETVCDKFTHRCDEVENIKEEEYYTTGLGKYAAEAFTENKYRQELNIPLRTTYSTKLNFYRTRLPIKTGVVGPKVIVDRYIWGTGVFKTWLHKMQNGYDPLKFYSRHVLDLSRVEEEEDREIILSNVVQWVDKYVNKSMTEKYEAWHYSMNENGDFENVKQRLKETQLARQFLTFSLPHNQPIWKVMNNPTELESLSTEEKIATFCDGKDDACPGSCRGALDKAIRHAYAVQEEIGLYKKRMESSTKKKFRFRRAHP